MNHKITSIKIVRLLYLILLISLSGCDSSSPGHSDRLTHQTNWRSLAVLAEDEIKPYSNSAVNSCRIRIQIPQETKHIAHPSNFGKRDLVTNDNKQLPINPNLIVLHETVLGENETLRLFATPHSNDNEQVSYHIIISRDGRIIRIVNDKYRAYGAGMSHFGGYTLRKKRDSSGSINNISLHISLVSPAGADGGDHHIGYTENQYKTLAKQVLIWQLKYGIPMVNVTTHQSVDRSHSRYDPRSFSWERFDRYHGFFAKICDSDGFAQHLN